MEQFAAVAIAVLSAAGFAGVGLAAMARRTSAMVQRPYAAAVAAGILLALAFGDLFPEGFAAAGDQAIVGFVAAFGLLYLVETLTDAHTHHDAIPHAPGDGVSPFVIGLAFHNLADGLAIGTSEHLSRGVAGALGVGIMVHQIPAGLSFVAILATGGASRRSMVRTVFLLASMIPLGTALTIALPVSGGTAGGVLSAVSAGLLAYVGSAHLLPEARTERHGRRTAFVFTATLIAMTALTLVLSGHG